MNDPDEVNCIYCGRTGTRGFRAVHSRRDGFVDQWCCAARTACAVRVDRSRRLAEPRVSAKARQLLKAELLLQLALKADRWAAEVEGSAVEPRMLPFEEWPEDDPRRALVRTYKVPPETMCDVLRDLAAELERRAERAGLSETWEWT